MNLQLEVLDIMYQALRRVKDARIMDVTLDNDNRDGEIILTVADGDQNRVAVIRSIDIVETDEV